jgi:HEAT repeat protein
MGFDLENFGLGVGVGWLSAYGVYRSRHVIRSAVQAAQKGAQQAQTSATRSADSRFVNDLIALCETSHLAASHVHLSDIAVEPRFIPAPAFASGGEEDLSDVMRVVPHIVDHPYLHAVYNLDTLTINDLSAGDRAIAILGAPGSGRTTALMAITLQSLGKITFPTPFDKVQARLDQEEAEMSEKQRAVRVKERVLMEQRARERLATEKGMTWNAETSEELKNKIPLFNQLMPIYVHMGNLNLSGQNEYGAEVDPAEPIVRAVQHTVGRVTASTIPRYLYDRLNRGLVLLLIDGYDELPQREQPLARAWLKALLEQYKDNFIIVTGPHVGYAELTGLGFTPVYMRPWSDMDAHWSAHRLAESWAAFGKKRRAKTAKLDDDAIARGRANIRAYTPFELTLKTWTNYAEDAERPGFEGWFQAYLARQLNTTADLPLTALLPNLTRIAALQIDEGYITPQRLQALAITGEAFGIQDTQTMPAAENAPSVDDLRPENTAETAKEKKDEDSETTTAQGRLLGLLRRGGLLVRYRGDRYQFKHPVIAAYLAGLTLKDAQRDIVRAKAAQPNWSPVLAYAAAHTNLDLVVRDRLTAPSDLLYSNIMEVARWMAFAPNDAAWRGAILKLLNDLVSAPTQFSLVRARATAALISTRDFKNAAYTFRRAARNLAPEIRRLAALGMGATGDPETVKDLIPLLDDQDMDTRVTAGLALGAIGSDEALEAMVIAFTSYDEPVRQAIAEQFALLPDEGHPILFEAMNEPDMAMRRAAIFGLHRTRTVWGLIAIYRAFLEDEQWYVRSAAQQAFEELQFGRAEPPTRHYPTPDQIAWLSEWAAEKGEQLPQGMGAADMLIRALHEADPPMRALAARNIGQLSHLHMIKSLYSALRDRHEPVRSAAYHALADVQIAIGKPLPAPV